jgi:integrase
MRQRVRCTHCSIDVNGKALRLRWYFHGRRFSKTVSKWRADATGWAKAREAKQHIDKYLAAGKDPRVLLKMPADPTKLETPTASITVREYYESWIEDKRPPKVRPAQARDYRRHIEGYVLPHLGNVPIPTLLPRDMTSLRDMLLNQPISGYGLVRLQMGRRETIAQRKTEVVRAKKRRRGGKYVVEEADADGVPRLSTKYVRNIIIGSFRAMLRDAVGIDMIPLQLSLSELCVGLKSGWGQEDEHEPDPDPFTPGERDAILEWFRTKTFGRVGRPNRVLGALTPKRVHPPFHVYLQMLFWTGMRPSEAAGLRWTDMDLEQRQGRVQGSRHSYFRSRKTKTKAARRTVQFTSETTALLKSIMPLHVEPDTPVFTNVDGEPVEPKVFSTHWYTCLRALGIRTRGLYCTKDTFCSLAVTRGVNPSWLEQQTGVAWATLKKHYAKYIPDQGRDQFEVMTGDGGLAGLTGSTRVRKL